MSTSYTFAPTALDADGIWGTLRVTEQGYS